MRLDQVAFRYGRGQPWVLSDVTIEIPAGRIVEITGKNGAGKSTLLRLLAGVYRPVRGRVLDRPGTVGYAPERFGVQPFSARSYLRAMADVRHLPHATITDWSDRLGLADLLDVRLSALSKGSLHKVGLIQALFATAAEGCLLLLDEPFAGLDANTRGALPGILREHADSGCTIVVSDHEGDLHDQPGVTHWNLRDHRLSPGTAEPAVAALRVIVPLGDATALTERLRAEGYTVDFQPRKAGLPPPPPSDFQPRKAALPPPPPSDFQPRKAGLPPPPPSERES